MSDQSDSDDPESPGVTFLSERESDGSGADHSDTDRSDAHDSNSHRSDSDHSDTDHSDSDHSDTDDDNAAFLDLEAAESDEHDSDHESHQSQQSQQHASFPQFARLPPELRAMIWEAADPYLLSEARVFEFIICHVGRIELWESAGLAHQTQPARALLATNRESRSIALKHYPDVLPLRGHRGDFRFKGSSDIIHTGGWRSFQDLARVASFSDKIRYLAAHCLSPDFDPTISPESLRDDCQHLKAFFWCFDPLSVTIRHLDWTVAESSHQFAIDPNLSIPSYAAMPGPPIERDLFCWPDIAHPNGFAETVGEEYMMQFIYLPKFGDVPVWPMVLYSSESHGSLYNMVTRKYGSDACYQLNFEPCHLSSELLHALFSDWDGPESAESESDHYELDGFVVDGSSEETDDESDDESDEGSDEGSDDDLNPVEDSSDEVQDPEPLDDHVSDASSIETQPCIAKPRNHRKRHVLSSEDEDDDDNGAGSGPEVESHSRVRKRARVILSDSDDDEGANGARSKVESRSHVRKLPRVILSDSEEMDDKDLVEREAADRSRIKKHTPVLISDHEDNDNGGEETEADEDESSEQEDDDEGGLAVSKQGSLLARLRQFRSDVPVPSEGGSTNSAEESEEDDEERLSNAEFPESAEEDEEEPW